MSAELTADLSRAIAGEEIVPHFQPLVDLRTGGLSGFAVLPRWHHPTRGIIHRPESIPLAEQTGLIGRLTGQLLHRAARAAAAWPGHLTLSVTLSPVQVRDRKLAGRLRAAVEGTGFPFDRLIFEISEAALIGHLELTRIVTGELKALGASLALGDCGIGYTNLRQLLALRFDRVKLGANFVHAMAARPESRKIVAAVIGLGHNLGMASVAEGVERQAEAGMLASLGCDIAQGRLFGHPVPADEVTANLAADDPPWHAPRKTARIAADLVPHLEVSLGSAIGQLRTLHDNASVGLGLVDVNLRYLALNRRLADLHGAPVIDHLGRTVAEMVPHLYSQIAPYLRRALSGEVLGSFELRWQGPGGTADEHVLVAAYEPVHDAADEVAGVRVAVMDITEVVRARGTQAGPAGIQDTRSRIPGLTQRQSEVMRLLATGRSVKEIARRLDLGVGTIRTYLSQAYRALGARNRTEALIHSGLMVNR